MLPRTNCQVRSDLERKFCQMTGSAAVTSLGVADAWTDAAASWSSRRIAKGPVSERLGVMLQAAANSNKALGEGGRKTDSSPPKTPVARPPG